MKLARLVPAYDAQGRARLVPAWREQTAAAPELSLPGVQDVTDTTARPKVTVTTTGANGTLYYVIYPV